MNRRLSPVFTFILLSSLLSGIVVGLSPSLLRAQTLPGFKMDIPGVAPNGTPDVIPNVTPEMTPGPAAGITLKAKAFSPTGRILPNKGERRLESTDEGAEGGTNEKTPAAFLLVEGILPEGSHLYSLTQPMVPGGYPTKIEITLPPDAPFTVGGFLLVSEIHFEDFMGETLEEVTEEFVALAPVFHVTPEEETALTPEEAFQKLSGLEITADFDALCCDDANCSPVQTRFPFIADPDADPLPFLDAIERNAKSNPVGESSATSSATPSVAPSSAPTDPGASSLFRWRNLIYAFFGGMILNIMPCVLPVIGLKIVSFFEQAGQSRSRAFFLNLCYSGGILTVFAVLALMSVGLSYLFTYGLFQIVMGGVVFVMALNLMGLWEITLPSFLGGRGANKLMGREGGIGAWGKGVITTLLAIPCGAPMLSPALVWTDAMIKEGAGFSVFGVYLLIGLGMATPFLLMGAFPELLRFLPKPGLWMETFRNVMGFVLLTAVVWILFSMPLPLVLPMVAFLFALWFSCWLIGKVQFDADRKKRRFGWVIALATVLIVTLFSFNVRIAGWTNPLPTLENAFAGKLVKWGIRAERDGELSQAHWVLFDKGLFDRALSEGKTVMVDFTADWCMNCKVLESTVLHTEEIEGLADRKGIVTMTGDWTNREGADENAVGELLSRYGGEQVPVLMIFTPDRPDPVILRGLFTKGTLLQTLESL